MLSRLVITTRRGSRFRRGTPAAPVLGMVMVMVPVVLGQPPAARTGFWSSFEAGDPQPSGSPAESASGVDGSFAGGTPGSVMGLVAEVTASGQLAAAGEVKENLVDGD